MAIPSAVASWGREIETSSPSKRIVAVVGGVDAGDRLHQRRLAGAVVADQADDLAGVDGEVDPVQSLDRAESLADSLELEEGSAGAHLSPEIPASLQAAA